MSFLSRRWQRQPAYPVRINWASPFAVSLAIAVYPGGGLRDVVTGALATRVGPTFKTAISKEGKAWHPQNETNAGIDFGVRQFISYPYFSFFAIAAPRTTGKFRSFFDQRDLATGSVGAYFNADADPALGASGYVSIYAKEAGSNYFCARAGSGSYPGGCVDGVLRHYGGSRTGNTAGQIYVGGLPISTQLLGTGPGASQFQTGQRSAVGDLSNYTGPVTSHDDPIVLVLGWNRTLYDDHHAEISEYPWQVLAPLTARIYSFPTQGFNAAWNASANTVIQPGLAAA